MATVAATSCSIYIPVWLKSKKSDTPLFRFTTQERGGAGYIDREGNVVIPPTLEQSGNWGDDDFFDGLAKVRLNDQEWFIDSTGKPIFRTVSGYTGHFSEGLASFQQGNKTGFFDREGRIAIPPSFDGASDFSEGMAVAGTGGLYGYINKNGGYVIPPQFKRASPFSDGAARVIESGPCVEDGYGLCGITAVRTMEAIEGATDKTTRCRYSFINPQGMRMFEGRYVEARDFGEGLAPVREGKLWGYVDKKGVLVIPTKYDSAMPFSEGLASVRSGSKWGYIDRTGAVVIPPTYTYAREFSEGMAAVGSNIDNWWFIDSKGNQAIPGPFTAVHDFVMGRAHVRQGKDYYSAKWSYIDKTGRAVFTYSDQSGKKQEPR